MKFSTSLALSSLLLLSPFAPCPAADKQPRTAPASTSSVATPSTASIPSIPPPKQAKWVFSLLPKSFQKNPLLDLTVFTEMTEAGKKLEAATRARPVYYESVEAGYRQVGDPVGEHPPPPAELLHAITNSLASGGYLRTDTAEHRPALLLVFHWGSHNRIDPEWAETDPLGALKNLIERARLVGGTPFANRLLKAYNDDAAFAVDGERAGGIRQVELLMESSDTMRNLIEQSLRDVYFVVASAYDYPAAAEGKHVLLWRTTMTSATDGVSMKQTLPPLIEIASPYFGHETPEAVPITKRGMKEGTVEIGEPTVIGIEEETAAPAAAPEKKP